MIAPFPKVKIMVAKGQGLTGAPTYGFRLKFFLPPGRTFQGVHPKRRLRFHDVSGRLYLVKLPQPKKNRLRGWTRYALSGKGFQSHGAALECGKRLKQALALFAADRRFGLNAGQDQATTSFNQVIIDTVAKEHGVQLRDDVHGLDVYVEQPPVTYMGVEGYGTSKFVIEGYLEPLEAFYDARVTFNPKQQLAIDLYNLSHFENIPKTRFLTLITVVEVLATRRGRSHAVRAQIKELIRAVRSSTLPDEEKRRLCDGIGNLKQESISSACREFVAQFIPEDEVAFFAECYKARSDLVHDGVTKRPEAIDPTKLDLLVSRLLIGALTARP
jgi:hypothetical protein